MASQRFYGLFDQAGMLSPLAGEQAAMFRVLPGVMPRTLIHGVTGKDVGGYEGNVGFLHPIGVADVTLANAPGYFGDAPATIQPGIGKPNPWLDPTAASGGA